MTLRIPENIRAYIRSNDFWSAISNQNSAIQKEKEENSSISNEKSQANQQLDLSQKLLLQHTEQMAFIGSQVDIVYQWNEKLPQSFIKNSNGELYYSQSRKVFIGTSDFAPRLVIKIETAEMREPRLKLMLPNAEEIAYKTCKLFHWNTVPKSKVLHQFSALYEDPSEKLLKYVKLMSCFKSDECPLTFTFQGYVEGKTLPKKVTKNTQDPDLSSYQKAYLLDIVLGKFDARGDNIIYNPRTGKLFEIDNEYIGGKGYESSGILNGFKKLKRKEVPKEILNDVLKTQLYQLAEIRAKYMVRDENLISLWNLEANPIFRDYGRQAREKCWSIMMKNLKYLQMSIYTLREQDKVITIEKLERGVNTLYLTENSPQKAGTASDR